VSGLRIQPTVCLSALLFEQLRVGAPQQVMGRLVTVPGGNAGRARLQAWGVLADASDDLLDLAFGAVRKQDRELVATPAAEDVDRAELSLPGGSRRDE
jgi:hypothetical protein